VESSNLFFFFPLPSLGLVFAVHSQVACVKEISQTRAGKNDVLQKGSENPHPMSYHS
jgi:hypothetical protein